MMHFRLLFLAIFTFQFANAQTNDASPFAASITVADLYRHLSVLTSTEMEGRETGTIGQRRAATYLAAQFKAMGLASVQQLKGYEQFYPLHQDSLMSATLKIDGYNAVYGKDFIITLNNNSSKKFKNKQLVFAGYGIADSMYNDYKNIDVKNKVAVIFSGEPKSGENYLISKTKRGSKWTLQGINAKIEAATAQGAAGILIISTTQETFAERAIAGSKKTNMYYPPEAGKTKKINYALISHEFATRLLANNNMFPQYLAQAKKNEAFEVQENRLAKKVNFAVNKNTIVTNASNVVGIIEGTDKKDEYVYVTGHYDHLGMRNGVMYPGADDDGSGTVGVLEMAEAFMQAKVAGKGPRRTMVFITVSGEEKGLWGSQYYSDHPVFPLEKASMNLNVDMIGRNDTERNTADTGNYVYVVGHDKLSSDLQKVNEGANNQYTKLVLDYKYDDPADVNRIYFRSDHYNFARKGVPILFFYDGMLKADYHRPTDTIDKINWALYQKRAQMIFYTAWEVANRNSMMARDIPMQNLIR